MNHLRQILKDNLLSSFEDIKINIAEENRIIIECRKESIITVLSHLKSDGFNHLSLISCVDWINENTFELVYILTAYTEDPEKGGLNLLVKTKVVRDKPTLYTVINVFSNAEPFERELHELYGIHFSGHPRLTPLLLERSYEIPPFRKDFDTRQYVEDFFKQIPTIEEKKRTNERT